MQSYYKTERKGASLLIVLVVVALIVVVGSLAAKVLMQTRQSISRSAIALQLDRLMDDSGRQAALRLKIEPDFAGETTIYDPSLFANNFEYRITTKIFSENDQKIITIYGAVFNTSKPDTPILSDQQDIRTVALKLP